MRRILLGLTLCWLLGPPPASAGSVSTEALIDRLILLDSHTPGVDPTAWYDQFMGDDQTPSFRGGTLGSPPPSAPPIMRELVRRGVGALPVLLRHLGDTRRTHIAIDFAGYGGFGGMVLEELYDPRERAAGSICLADCNIDSWMDGHYTVTVGDLCYVLIGQIVDRNLFAVAYQPTAIVLIDSPILLPDLARRTRADWSGLSAEDHKRSLLSDLRNTTDDSRIEDALRRLRLYYPAVYAALGGDDAAKRAKFETAEKTQ